MSDSSVDEVIFAYLASCVGDFIKWPQCSIAALRGNNEGGRLSTGLFKAAAMNPYNRTIFYIIVTKDDDWRVRVIQLSNHVILDEPVIDRHTIVNAVNRFVELTGMVEGRES